MRFSIVVPVYNVEKYLSDCVCSLLNQTFKDYEIILIDDGSKDSSGCICDSFSKNERITVIHKENTGLSDTRNLGISIAKGDYIIFVDSDDVIMPNSLLDFNNLLAYSPDVLITRMTNTYNIEEAAKVSTECFSMPKRLDAIKFLFGKVKSFTPAAVQYIAKRELLINNNILFEKGYLHEDFVWMPLLFSFAKSFAFYNKSWYLRRLGVAGSITNSFNDKRLIDILSLTISYFNTGKLHNFSIEELKVVNRCLASSLLSFLKNYSLLNPENKKRVCDLVDHNINLFKNVYGLKRKLFVASISIFGCDKTCKLFMRVKK